MCKYNNTNIIVILNRNIYIAICVTSYVNKLFFFYLTLGALTDFTNKVARAPTT